MSDKVINISDKKEPLSVVEIEVKIPSECESLMVHPTKAYFQLTKG